MNINIILPKIKDENGRLQASTFTPSYSRIYFEFIKMKILILIYTSLEPSILIPTWNWQAPILSPKKTIFFSYFT